MFEGEISGGTGGDTGAITGGENTSNPVTVEPTKTEAKEIKALFEGEFGGKKVSIKDAKDLEKMYHLANGAHTAQRKAAELEKALEEAKNFKLDKKTAIDFLKDRGVDPDELADDRMIERLRRSQMTPEQIEAEKNHRETNEDYDKVKTENEKYRNMLAEIEYKNFDSAMFNGFKERGIPYDTIFPAIVARKALAQKEAGQEIDLDGIMDEVGETYRKSLRLDLTDESTEADLLKKLSPEDLTRLRKILAKQAAEPEPVRKGWSGQESNTRKPQAKLSMQDVMRGKY